MNCGFANGTLIEFRYAAAAPQPAESKVKEKADARAQKRKAKAQASSSAGSFLTFVDLEYLFTAPGDKMVFARRAIQYLTKMHRDYQGREYLKELDALEAKGASDEEVERFRFKTLVENNPELDFAEVLFRHFSSLTPPAP